MDMYEEAVMWYACAGNQRFICPQYWVRKDNKPNAGFMKPMQPDAALAQVVGSQPIPRTEITKKLWAYIKKNGLQDKVNKRNINPDDKLAAVFGGEKSVSMFEMTKLVSKHIG